MANSKEPEIRSPGLLSKYLLSARSGRVAHYARGDVLELGCGLGMLRRDAGPELASYFGLDADRMVLDQAKVLHPDAEFYWRDLESDRFDLPKQFDVVIMAALIEHILNQGHVIGQAVEALKPGGRLVFTTPTPFGNDIVHRFGAAIGLFSKLAAEHHVVIYNKRRFECVAKRIGLELEEYETFQFGCNQLAVLRKPEKWNIPQNPLVIKGRPFSAADETRQSTRAV